MCLAATPITQDFLADLKRLPKNVTAHASIVLGVCEFHIVRTFFVEHSISGNFELAIFLWCRCNIE